MIRKIFIKLLRTLHKAYKLLLSPFFGNACRFYPYCSDYAMQAFELHGPLKASFLTIKRIARCNPYCEGGFDPVPESPQSKKVKAS